MTQPQEEKVGTVIFSSESGATETWLVVNDDGSVTFVTENSGWRMARRGMERKESSMTAEEAKERWPSYAEKIDAALTILARKHTKGGEGDATK